MGGAAHNFANGVRWLYGSPSRDCLLSRLDTGSLASKTMQWRQYSTHFYSFSSRGWPAFSLPFCSSKEACYSHRASRREPEESRRCEYLSEARHPPGRVRRQKSVLMSGHANSWIISDHIPASRHLVDVNGSLVRGLHVAELQWGPGMHLEDMLTHSLGMLNQEVGNIKCCPRLSPPGLRRSDLMWSQKLSSTIIPQ